MDFITIGKGLRFTHQGELVMTVLGPHEWSNPEWAQLLEQQTAGRPGMVRATISYMERVMPDAKQRREASVASHVRGGDIQRMAVITTSKVARGIVKAFSWLVPGPTLTAYAPQETMAALTWLRERAVFDLHSAHALFHRMVADAGYGGLPRPGADSSS